ncbi:hypothetical protein, partial [Actinocorallia lasiicapitis]
MRKVVLIWLTAFVAAIGAAALVVTAVISPDGLNKIALLPDAQVQPLDPAGLVPGSRFGYKIKVVNQGPRPVSDFTIRSEKVVGGRAGAGLGAYRATGAACRTG